MLTSKTIGILGAGNMGEALVAGLLKANIVEPGQIIVSRRTEAALAYLADTYGVQATKSNIELVSKSDLIVLSVKPQILGSVLDRCAPYFREGQVVISIAAGITTKFIEEKLQHQIPVVRVMPNLPALVGEAISPYCLGSYGTAEQALLASQIFSAVGRTVLVREEYLDAITALSGTGPAYLFYLLEGLIEAGIEMGLPEHLVKALVRQTTFGAAKLVVETTRTPSQLRAQVTSPQGTTHSAITYLEAHSFLEVFKQAVFRARDRAIELGHAQENNSEEPKQ